MKLDVDFSGLWTAVTKMGAKEIDFDISADFRDIDPIDRALNEGVEVKLEDIDFDTGLASYHGRQVLLYIKDHGVHVDRALGDGSTGNKYHVADCSMLDKMRKRGRYDRYVVKNDLTGKFKISGVNWQTGKSVEGETELKVCKLCLSHLNYQGYRNGNREKIFNSFSLTDFFDKYSSFFKNAPSGVADTKFSDYTENWQIISKNIKERHNYICQKCGLDLSFNMNLLHVHHKNGVKQDNRKHNLIPLCADCHGKQPLHTHLFLSHGDTVKISQLRNRQQIKIPACWDDIYDFADPAMHGVISLLERTPIDLPRIGWELTDGMGNVMTRLELGWPDRRIAIVISKETAIIARKLGWEAFSMRNGLQYTQNIVRKLMCY